MCVFQFAATEGQFSQRNCTVPLPGQFVHHQKYIGRLKCTQYYLLEFLDLTTKSLYSWVFSLALWLTQQGHIMVDRAWAGLQAMYRVARGSLALPSLESLGKLLTL